MTPHVQSTRTNPGNIASYALEIGDQFVVMTRLFEGRLS
jgi:hypothetical protein